MKLLRVDSSIRTEGSISREVADSAQQAWLAEHPEGEVILRALGARPVSIETWMAAASTRTVPADERTPEQQAALDLAGELLAELLAADAYLIAVPLYNWGVPATLKLWIDLLFTLPDLGPAGTAPLAGRPGVLVIARGGGYGPGTPRDGWDHSTPWLERIFGEVWQLDLRTVVAELTLANVVPAMAELRDLAAASLSQAHTDADRHGREIARANVAV